MKKSFVISLDRLKFHAHHGVFPQETAVGNEFIVDLSVTIPYDESVKEDNLGSTVSYAGLYEIVAEEMGKPRKLLETVADSIADRICSTWPQVSEGFITISKSTPPIKGITGSASVRLNF